MPKLKDSRSEKKKLEQKLLDRLIEQRDLPKWHNYPNVSNFRFNLPSGMELDIAWPDHKIGLEVNGGQWSSGKSGHNSGTGVERDARKINIAQLKGWLILIFVTDHINKQMDQYTIPTIRKGFLLKGVAIVDYDAELKTLFVEELVDWDETDET